MFSSICRGIPVNFILVLCFVIFILSHSRFSATIDEVPGHLTAYFNRSISRTSPAVEVHTVHAPPEYCPTAVVQVSCPSPEPIELPCPLPNIQDAPGKRTREQETIARLREEGIVVVFKTGAQEISQVAIHLGTTLRYFEEADILFFSDLQSTIGPFVVNNALKTVDQDIRMHHKDFELYHELQRFQTTGQDLLELKEERSKGDGRSGWRLDKYKFIHMVEQTFLMRPAAKWYVFIETDSYVVWPNLIEWLKKYDSRKPWYLGAAVMMGPTVFGHGGSGYVLSNAAMNKLLGPEHSQGLAASWDAKMDDECCGDVALAKALKEQGVKLTGAHPYLNGYKPSTFTYGPREHWCQPVVSMHHLAPLDISSVWRFERQRELLLKDSNTTTFSELYFHFAEPHLMESRDNWDNFSDETMYTEADLDAEVEDEVKKHQDEEEHKADDGEVERLPEILEDEDMSPEERQKIVDEMLKNMQEEVVGEEDESPKDDQEEKMEDEEDEPKMEVRRKKAMHRLDDKQSKDEPEEGNEKRGMSKDGIHRRDDKPALTELEKNAHKSFDDCREVCASKPDCFQWLYYGKICRLEFSFRLGQYRAPESRDDDGKGEEMVSFRSGWMIERIREWTEENPCDIPDWV